MGAIFRYENISATLLEDHNLCVSLNHFGSIEYCRVLVVLTVTFKGILRQYCCGCCSCYYCRCFCQFCSKQIHMDNCNECLFNSFESWTIKTKLWMYEVPFRSSSPLQIVPHRVLESTALHKNEWMNEWMNECECILYEMR